MAPRKRLHIITGKGGTGKTTVAASLAMTLAREGRHVLLCEVEGRQGIAQLFDVPPLPYEERLVASSPDGGQVYALAIDAEAALLEYLSMFYRLGRAGKALDRFGIIDFATTIAPGVRDVLLTGKVYEAVRRRKSDGEFVYDAVVVDAPPTGRIARFLNVNSEVAGLAKVGPIRRQADSIMSLLRAKRTAVHIVTVLEEMPVQETLDGIAELREAELPVGRIFVNQVRHSPLDPDLRTRFAELDSAAVRKALATEGLPADGPVADALLAEGAADVERQDLQNEQRATLASIDRPVHELPQLPDDVDLGGIYRLAAILGEEGIG
ncbi:AAA family ATPase [Nocardioidaceae bacterium SCSIO 66511]|nr:AAA family ATPase [Nocardioidaceae bacterium SCSIO 66511]